MEPGNHVCCGSEQHTWWKGSRPEPLGSHSVCLHIRAFPPCVAAVWSHQQLPVSGPSLGAAPCALAVFLLLAFPEGGLLVGTPACCTKQVAGLMHVFTCRQLPAPPLTCVSAGVPATFCPCATILRPEGHSPGMWAVTPACSEHRKTMRGI